MYARGTIVGLTRGTGKAHIVRATLESIAYQSADLVGAMATDCGVKPVDLRVDGGASANQFLMQYQADILGCNVSRPETIETTARGAAMLAGLAVGVWKNLDELRAIWKRDITFVPTMSEEKRMNTMAGWHKAISRSMKWIEADE